MKLYVASSWRNELQPGIVVALRVSGFDVYDFKNPKEGDHGFHWKDVLLERDERGYCDPDDLKKALTHTRAVEGFALDFGAMKWADACVLVLPCGRSAHLEAGWMAGAGKPVIVYARGGDMIEPELMYGLLGPICTSLDQVVSQLRGARPVK